MAADLMQKVPQERGGLDPLNVVLKELAIERTVKPAGADGDARYGRDTIVTVTMVQDRRPPDRAPGFADGRNQEEARLVDEDDVGCQPRGVFFTAGQTVRFHRAIAVSFRSSARRSGFW